MKVRAACCATLLLLAGGCRRPMSEATVQDAESAYSRAEGAFAADNYEAALPDYTLAIETGGVRGDLLANAFVSRAVCFAAAGDIEKALADVKIAEQGTPDADRFHSAQGFICYKQGNIAAAKEHFRAAQRANSKITIPVEMR